MEDMQQAKVETMGWLTRDPKNPPCFENTTGIITKNKRNETVNTIVRVWNAVS